MAAHSLALLGSLGAIRPLRREYLGLIYTLRIIILLRIAKLVRGLIFVSYSDFAFGSSSQTNIKNARPQIFSPPFGELRPGGNN